LLKFLFKLMVFILVGAILGFYGQQVTANSKDNLLLPLSLFALPVIFSQDEKITSDLSSEFDSGSGRKLMEILSFFGDGGFHIFLLGSLYFHPDTYTRETARLAFKSWVRAGIYTGILKFSFGRARPDQDRKGFFGPGFKYDSFPSGHTSAAFSLATVLGERYRKMKGFFYTVATLIGLSRVALRRHYPSDVLVGALIGYFAGKQILNESNSKRSNFTIFPTSRGLGVCLSIR